MRLGAQRQPGRQTPLTPGQQQRLQQWRAAPLENLQAECIGPLGLGLSCTLALGMGARAAKTRAAVPVAVAGVGALASVYYGLKVREWSS